MTQSPGLKLRGYAETAIHRTADHSSSGGSTQHQFLVSFFQSLSFSLQKCTLSLY